MGGALAQWVARYRATLGYRQATPCNRGAAWLPVYGIEPETVPTFRSLLFSRGLPWGVLPLSAGVGFRDSLWPTILMVHLLLNSARAAPLFRRHLFSYLLGSPANRATLISGAFAYATTYATFSGVAPHPSEGRGQASRLGGFVPVAPGVGPV